MSHLLDHRLIGQRYFFPRADRTPSPVFVDVEDAVLHCHAHHPEAGAPTLLHFHGNGEVVADWVPELPQGLAQRGLNTFLAEYRGYGGSTGEPQLHRMLDDALIVADRTGVEPSKLVVYGRSVGSLFALHVAAHRNVAGLILESGIADVRERIALRVSPEELGVGESELVEALEGAFDHRAKLEAFSGPVLILHADHDHLVSVEHAEQLAAWAGERALLRRYPRGDHNSIHAENGSDILDEVAAFAGTR